MLNRLSVICLVPKKVFMVVWLSFCRFEKVMAQLRRIRESMAMMVDINCDSCSEVAISLFVISANRVDGTPGECHSCGLSGKVVMVEDGQWVDLIFQTVTSPSSSILCATPSELKSLL